MSRKRRQVLRSWGRKAKRRKTKHHLTGQRSPRFEPLEARRLLAVLSNGPGDGTVTVSVDGFGAYGSSIGSFGSNASYDPVGPVGTAGTTYLSGVSLNVGGSQQWLATGFGSNKPDPATEGSNTLLVSSFAVAGLDFELEQRLSDLFVGDGEGGAERSGSLLTQAYTITNTLTNEISFDLSRYVDGDLAFDGSISDGGGRLPFGDSEILFETDSATGSADEATFVGITAEGGVVPETNRYEISSYSALRSNIQANNLHDSIAGDGADEDQFIDAGSGYDLALGLRNTFTLPAGESTVYVTRSIFGTGNPDALAQVDSLLLSPEAAEQPVTSSHAMTVFAQNDIGEPVAGAFIQFVVSGANPTSSTAFTDFNGEATFIYHGDTVGQDSITASGGLVTSNTVVVDWTPVPNLVVSDPIVPMLVRRGSVFDVRWTVTNDSADTAAIAPWGDSVYLSSDAVLDASDTLLGSPPAHNTDLVAGGQYDQLQTVSIPSWVALGDYFLLAVADVADSVFESNELDNVVATPIEVSLPDLVIDTAPIVTVEGAALFGSSVEVSWTVRNDGNVAAIASTQDTIWLSTDAFLGEIDQYVTDIPIGSHLPLAPGESYTETATITLPLFASASPGDYHLIVDVGSEPQSNYNNDRFASASFAIELPPLPDLFVSSIVAPLSAVSNGDMPITWEITNLGDAPATGVFRDRIALSSDATIGNDTQYGQFEFSGTIAPGQTLVRTQNISLPPQIEGDFHVVVTTDIFDEIFEQPGTEANNASIAGVATEIALAPFPNLQVAEVISPITGASGQDVVVEWVVTNAGTGGTNTPVWNDRVYLSVDTTFDSSDVFLGTLNNPAFLAVGDSYRSTLTARLPQGIDGDYYFIVRTDVFNSVFELDGENDNAGVSTLTDVQLTPPPDLRVTNVSAPNLAFSGQPVSVNWTVTNNGAGGTLAGVWTDRLFVSEDNVLDAGDTLLADVQHSGSLNPGAGYDSGAAGVLPVDISGDYFFIVQTDAFDQVFEHAFEANNTGHEATPTDVRLTPPPDLEVDMVDAPILATSSRALVVDYHVTNFGATSTVSSYWTDSLYLSEDQQFGENDIHLQNRTHFATIEPGTGYSGSFNVTLADDLVGNFYVLVVADTGDRVFEGVVGETNNVGLDAELLTIESRPADLVPTNFIVPGSAESGNTILLDWVVENNGVGDTAVSAWADQVWLSADATLGTGDRLLSSLGHNGLLLPGQEYHVSNQQVTLPFSVTPGDYFLLLEVDSGQNVYEPSNEGNNHLARPISISRETSDLQVATIDAAATAISGGQLAVSWAVGNLGAAATHANVWVDEVYLSLDTQFDASDIHLGAVLRSNPLASGDSYQVDRGFSLPNEISGEYFVIVRTDTGQEVIEGAFENNNSTISTQTVQITLAPSPDLTVSVVDAPLDAFSGQPIELSWTVKNLGLGAAEGTWFDAVYLSLDQVFDRNSDIYLGFANRQNELVPGASYTQTVSFDVPAGISGPYWAFVAADSSNRIFERGAELNNATLDPFPILVTLTPPADFVVGTITVPASGIAGQQATIGYTVENQGDNAAVGTWVDSIYLSADDQWDINDPLFGRVTSSQANVPGGDSYSQTLTAALPGVVPGNYHVIVRSDILNRIPESDLGNNIGISLDQAAVDFGELQLGVAATAALATGQAVYYKVEVPAGETLSLLLDSAALSGANELYLAHERIPSRSNFDSASIAPFEVDQRVVIPFTEAGTYYVLAYGNSVAGAQSFDLTAELLDFDVLDSNYGQGGTVGERTIRIAGAKFDPTTEAVLTDSNGFVLPASAYHRISSVEMYATFDLTSVAPGTYDVVVSQAGASSVTVSDGLEVVEVTSVSPLRPTVDAPSRVRRGAAYSFVVQWGNDSLNDVPVPFLRVGNTEPFGKTFNDPIYGTRHTFLASRPEGPQGILLPGDAFSRTFFTSSTSFGPSYTSFVDRVGKDPSEAFDWQGVKPELRPAEMDDALWDSVFNAVKSNVGDTWGDALTTIRANVELVAAGEGDRQPGLVGLLRPEVLRAQAEIGNSIQGSIQLSLIENTVTHWRVIATENTTGAQFGATTYNDGSFAIAGLDDGTYTLAVQSDAYVQQFEVEYELTNSESIENVVLEPATPVDATLKFVTVDGNPTVGAAVSIYLDGLLLGQTLVGEEGTVSFVDIPATQYLVTVSLEGYATERVNLDLTGPLATQLSQATLGFGATVSGNVVPSDGGIADFVVTAIPSGQTGTIPVFAAINGNQFEFEALSSGAYDLTIYASDQDPVLLENVTVPESGELVIDPINLSAATASLLQAASIGSLGANGSQGANLAAAAAPVEIPFWFRAAHAALDQATPVYSAGLDLSWAKYHAANQSMSLFTSWHFRRSTTLSMVAGVSLGDSSAISLYRQYFDSFGPVGMRSVGVGFAMKQELKLQHQSTFDSAMQEAIKAIKGDDPWKEEFDCDEGHTETYQVEDLYKNLNADAGAFLGVGSGAYSGGSERGDKETWRFKFIGPIGVLAGGTGSWGTAGSNQPETADWRKITGTITATLDSEGSTVEVTASWQFKLSDGVDFVPGNDLNGILGLKPLENQGMTWDVPFNLITDIKVDPGEFGIKRKDDDECDPCESDNPPDDCDDTDSPVSSDPNDILGPEGFGPENWVAAESTLEYTIRFENDPIFATAPAQVVRVTQQLDSNFDFRTFRIGDFAIGTNFIEVPANQAFYANRLDLTADLGVLVDVFAGIDVTTGEAFWEISAIDPETGEQPEDPLDGLLPPNLTSPEGEGFFTYSIRPLSGSVTGDRIDAEARIVFDINEPIDTPPIFHTLDADLPTSAVDSLPAGGDATTFDISWSGVDVPGGSGVATYDVFVSENDNPFTPFLVGTTLTSTQFVGEAGRRYGFYSIAHDNAGNIEAAPAVADADIMTPGTPPFVTGYVIQNGLPQRSFVDTISIDFSTEMNFANLISSGEILSAVTLTNLGVDATADTDQQIALSVGQFQYAFDASADLSRLSWSLDEFSPLNLSLEDGLYELTLDAIFIADLASNSLDGDGDGNGGDSSVLLFHRLLGDADGNAVVDSSDMQVVNEALGTLPTTANWNENADLDRDGRITVRDRILVARATGHTIVSVTGDLNRDGTVDATDFMAWGNNYGSIGGDELVLGDSDHDNDVDGFDFLNWQRAFRTETITDVNASSSLQTPQDLPAEEADFAASLWGEPESAAATSEVTGGLTLELALAAFADRYQFRPPARSALESIELRQHTDSADSTGNVAETSTLYRTQRGSHNHRQNEDSPSEISRRVERNVSEYDALFSDQELLGELLQNGGYPL